MRHTKTIRLDETEEKLIAAAAALTEVGPTVFLRVAGLASAVEVVAQSGRHLESLSR